MAGELSPLSGQHITKQNERLAFALQAAEVGTWDLDIINQQVWWDERCKQLYGFHEEDVVPYEQVLQYMHPDDADLVDQAVRWALNPQSGGQYDIQFRTLGASDGQLRWLHCRGRAFFDEQGTPYRFSGIAQDITQFVQARHQLEIIERQFDNLVMDSPTATAVYLGREMVVQSINQPMLTIWGKDASVIGKTLHEAMPELIGQPFLELLQHVYDTGDVYRNTEGKADIVVDGRLQEFWFNFSYNPLHDKNGRICGVINTATDVTAQVTARRELAKRELQLQTIIDEAPVAIGLFAGPDIVVQQYNKLFMEVMGRGPDVVGKPLTDVMPDSQKQPFLQPITTVYTSRQPFRRYSVPVSVIRDGALCEEFYNLNYVPLLDETGQSYAVLGIAVEVTGEVQLRQQAQRAQQLLQQSIDMTQLATWQIDVASNTATFSDRKLEWLSLGEGPVLMETVLASVAPDDQDRFLAAMDAAYDQQTGGQFRIEYTLVNRETGRRRIIHSIGQTEFNEAGKPVQMTGISGDVTSDREQQLALELLVEKRTEELATSVKELATNNEELAEANSLLVRSNNNLQQFAYIASHDLQEPLRKIQQFSDLLKAKHVDAAGEEFMYLDRMQVAAFRMSTLIRDLLSYSRISTQRNTDAPVPLNQVVEEVLNVLDLVIADTQAQITVDELPVLSGDATQLGQLFQNLLGNALKFRRPGVPPRLHISSRLVTANALPLHIKPTRQTSSFAQIDVTDNGIGFDEKYLDRIFQVFQRLHSKSQYVGTGIGLAICEKVVTNHGGAITATSQPGQGTTFTIYLPA